MKDEGDGSVLSSTRLEAALQRLLAGTATQDDRSAVRSALLSGVLVTGDRAVAIGGNAHDVVIATGDGNTILSFKGSDATAIQAVLSSIAPTRLHELPPPPRDFTGRADELAELTAKLEQGGITISKRHVWIGVKEGRVIITDQNSRNGTFVNDPKSQRVTETPLTLGDTVILGESDVARFEYQK